MKLSLLPTAHCAYSSLLSLVCARSGRTDFPNRTVRILVGFAPGGTTDLLGAHHRGRVAIDVEHDGDRWKIGRARTALSPPRPFTRRRLTDTRC